jgi:hypothetical protein
MNSIMIGTGALLVLAGILGGGFTVPKIKLPKLGSIVRVISTIVGLALILIAVAIGNPTPNQTSKPAPLVKFTIRDQLGQDQLSEKVRILINGCEVGNLSVDAVYPSSSITVNVQTEGKYSYALEADAVFEINKRLKEYVGVGQGTVEVSDGKIFELVGTISGDTLLAHLEEVPK